MSDRKRNVLDALVRIDYFGEATPQLATDVPYTVELFLANKTIIERLNQAGITLASSIGAGLSGTASKVARAAEIEADLRLVARTAVFIPNKFPDFQNTFILPRGYLTYDQIIHYSEAFIADATPNEAEFNHYALPKTFFTALATKLAGFRDVAHDQADGKRTSVGANAEGEDALRDGLANRKELDRVIKNHYRNDPQKLAEWLTASHIKQKQSGDDEGNNNPPDENPPSS